MNSPERSGIRVSSRSYITFGDTIAHVRTADHNDVSTASGLSAGRAKPLDQWVSHDVSRLGQANSGKCLKFLCAKVTAERRSDQHFHLTA